MRRRLLIALPVAAVAVLALLAVTASKDEQRRTYLIEVDNAFGLVEGGDLKVGGVRAGQTIDFRLSQRRDRPTALAEVEISEPGFADFRRDARCRVRQQSLIGEYFLDCQPGKSGRRLPVGGRLPLERTNGTIPQDLINSVLRRPYRERLRLIIAELGTGLAGRPEDLNDVIRRAHPGLRETNEVLAVLARQRRTIAKFIHDSDTVVAALARRKRDVGRWVTEAGETAEISASRRQALAEQVRRLPGFLDELEPTMQRLGVVADEQVPLLRDLRRAAPTVDSFLAELGPFSRAAVPAVRSLGRAAGSGRSAIGESRDEVRELRTLSAAAPRFGKPLAQFLQTLDDRDRFAFDPDRRAVDTAPPTPDPTHAAKGKGFTGMESLLNFFYWSALAVNQYDELGHLLRIVPFESHCGEYYTGAGYRYGEPHDKEVEETFDECKAWVGPHQPGITAPDPTAGNAARTARAQGSRAVATPAPAKPAAPPALLDYLLGP